MLRLFVLGSLALAGCGACNSSPAATTEFFGSTIEPPRGLAKVHPGMTVAEAKKLVPGLHEPDHKTIRDELVLDSGASNVQLEVRTDNGAVSSIVAIVDGHIARDLLEHAWGKPEIERDSLGQPEVTWSSESSGWKVKLDCLERNCLVEYSPYHVLTADYFGAHVVPPGELSKLRIGMPLAQAKLLAPGPVSVRAGIPTDVDGVREYVGIDDRSATVKSIYLNVPAHAEDLIAQAWGPGKEASEYGNKSVFVWPDAETGWRATLRPALGSSHDLAFENYMPAAQLLGDQPETLAGLPQPVLGHTLEELKKTYKDELTVIIPSKEAVLSLPPTEWEHGATRIQLALAGGKVRELSFEIPWKAFPDAKVDLLENLFKKKWGDFKEIEVAGGTALLFREDDPRVEIKEDTNHGAWAIVIK